MSNHDQAVLGYLVCDGKHWDEIEEAQFDKDRAAVLLVIEAPRKDENNHLITVVTDTSQGRVIALHSVEPDDPDLPKNKEQFSSLEQIENEVFIMYAL